MKKAVKSRVMRGLRIVAGQVRGLEKLVENDTYCMDVITQIAAARQALSAIDDAVLESHLSTCVVGQMKGGAHARAVKELLAAYKVSKRK